MSTTTSAPTTPAAKPEGAPESNFIRDMVVEDNQTGKHKGRVATRFPPEPNGYLHIGHAKSIVLNFGLARAFNGTCNLRFDDTNPSTEDTEYVDSIQEDVKWLGYSWDNLLYASDYFEKTYVYTQELIRRGLAYVCDQTVEQMREARGGFGVAGKNSPFRDRTVQENLDLFARMRAGEFADGQKTVRAKMDMASPNMNLRDPPLWRIKKVPHHRTGTKWCIYPMYDYAHPISDAEENITHSICTLEFEDHRPLYDWTVQNLPVPGKPQQIEFARLNLTYTILSKRKLLQLVQEKHVSGWDDPRMPTVSGLRRRGYPPEAIRAFCERIGVSKRDSVVDVALLEHAVREDLNARAPRVMGVLRPLKVTVTNWPAGKTEWLECPFHADKPEWGTRKVPFGGTLYIEQEDFMENPPKKFFRLSPGKEVRLRWAYFIKCTEVKKDAAGNITEVLCTYDPETRSGNAPDGRKVKATMHWVDAQHALPADIRLYDRLFNRENPNDESDGKKFLDHMNPNSLVTLKGFVEPGVKDMDKTRNVQFERTGYFVQDAKESAPHGLVFNRTVGLRDAWANINKAGTADE